MNPAVPSSGGRSHLRQLANAVLKRVLPASRYLVDGPRHGASVCLTFDDGPDPACTPAVLDVLNQYDVPAAFFVIGQNAREHPEILQRIAADGHLIGNHSFTHAVYAQSSARKLLEEVRQTEDAIQEIVGSSNRLFRPPWGKLSPWEIFLLLRDKWDIVLWNKDPRDFAAREASDVTGSFERDPLVGGDLVLLHDDHPHAAEALPQIILDARSRGIRFTTPAEWMGGEIVANHTNCEATLT